MELISKLIVNPILWIVYITLPLLSGPLASKSPSHGRYVDIIVSQAFWGNLLNLCVGSALTCTRYFLGGMKFDSVGRYQLILVFGWIVTVILDASKVPLYARFPRILHSVPVANISDNNPVPGFLCWLFFSTIFAVVFHMWIFLPVAPLYYVLRRTASLFYRKLGHDDPVTSTSAGGEGYSGSLPFALRNFISVVLTSTTLFFILSLKNRKACQLLSALSALVIGVSKVKAFAAIPVSFGIFLTIPDLDVEPWIKFRVRFLQFLVANMDQESLDALLNSKFCKMVSCNEMMPSRSLEWYENLSNSNLSNSNLEPTYRIGLMTSSKNKNFSNSNLEPVYRIGLGYIVTTLHKNRIDVGVFTPFSGVKRMTIKDTPRSRYNLDKSARFWRDNPRRGLQSLEKVSLMLPEELKIYCMSTDEWIKACGADNSIFVEYLFSTSETDLQSSATIHPMATGEDPAADLERDHRLWPTNLWVSGVSLTPTFAVSGDGHLSRLPSL